MDIDQSNRKRSADEARLKNLELARKRVRLGSTLGDAPSSQGGDTTMGEASQNGGDDMDLRKYVTLNNRINYLENYVVDQEKHLYNANDAIAMLRLQQQQYNAISSQSNQRKRGLSKTVDDELDAYTEQDVDSPSLTTSVVKSNKEKSPGLLSHMASGLTSYILPNVLAVLLAAIPILLAQPGAESFSFAKLFSRNKNAGNTSNTTDYRSEEASPGFSLTF